MSIIIAVFAGIAMLIYLLYSFIIIVSYLAGVMIFIRDINKGTYTPLRGKVSVALSAVIMGVSVLMGCGLYLGSIYPKLVSFLSDTSVAILCSSIFNLIVTLTISNSRKSLLFNEVGWFVNRVTWLLLPYPLMFLSVYHYFS